MIRRNTVRVGEILRLFWQDHPELYHQMLEVRIQRLWKELLGPSIAHYTTQIYVKNRVLYVCISSSVVRTELLSLRKTLVEKLNTQAGASVIDDIVIR